MIVNYSLQGISTGKLGNGYKGSQHYYLLKLHVTLCLSQNTNDLGESEHELDIRH